MLSKYFKYCLFIALLCFFFLNCNQPVKTNNTQLTVVKFGMLPYGDHSQAIIAVKKGWFKDVGIDFQYKLIKVEATIPALNSNELDVASSNANILLSSYQNAKDLCMFTFADVFQGYALMAQPNKGYKSYDEFIREGQSPGQAIKNTVQQLKGKAFAYPSETAIKPFINILLEKGGLKGNSFKSLVQDDPLNVNAMRRKTADFQVGGVPSRITLQKEGFIPLISSIDIVKAATPSPQSKELASVFNDGWAIKKDFYTNHRDIVLKLASVNFRINAYIKSNPDSALFYHMPYLSQITGEQFTNQDGKIIYNYLDPFYDFNDQKSWFYNAQDPLYYKNLYGSIINNFAQQGLYKDSVPTPSDIIYADKIYFELEQLKSKSEQNFKKIESASNLSKSLTSKLTEAKKAYDIYDYFDSEKISSEIVATL